ncbi:hypothetical protein ACQKL0_01815 [Peribacillus sp. NPDC097264]|uniref:hypothetical protein n=1 Tax=unclassified Peribacillus TaxID=2675266 RepID=UPI00380F50EC
MSEKSGMLSNGQKRNRLLFSSMQDKQRVEQLIGDLIGHVAKTHVQTKENEDELKHLRLKVAQLESYNKYLHEHNEKLDKRVTNLEKVGEL